MTPLWKSDHPYHCKEGNYCSRDAHTHFVSWAEFIEEYGDSDPDMNLVFRWDWELETDDDGEPLPDLESRGADLYYRGERLLVFFMGQRKARCWSVSIDVCRADEPEARAWLQSRWEHLRKLWAPLSGVDNGEEPRDMTVKELIAELSKLNQDALVVLAKDREGNDYSPHDAISDGLYEADTTWSGDYYGDAAEAADEGAGDTVSCVVLWPVN